VQLRYALSRLLNSSRPFQVGVNLPSCGNASPNYAHCPSRFLRSAPDRPSRRPTRKSPLFSIAAVNAPSCQDSASELSIPILEVAEAVSNRADLRPAPGSWDAVRPIRPSEAAMAVVERPPGPLACAEQNSQSFGNSAADDAVVPGSRFSRCVWPAPRTWGMHRLDSRPGRSRRARNIPLNAIEIFPCDASATASPPHTIRRFMGFARGKETSPSNLSQQPHICHPGP